jgi:hypothetical protein
MRQTLTGLSSLRYTLTLATNPVTATYTARLRSSPGLTPHVVLLWPACHPHEVVSS